MIKFIEVSRDENDCPHYINLAKVFHIYMELNKDDEYFIYFAETENTGIPIGPFPKDVAENKVQEFFKQLETSQSQSMIEPHKIIVTIPEPAPVVIPQKISKPKKRKGKKTEKIIEYKTKIKSPLYTRFP